MADVPGADRASIPVDTSSLMYLLGLSFQHVVQTFLDRMDADGHLGLRPVHGFALWVINRGGVTSVELAARLGVTKQATGPLIEHLERAGYVERQPHPLGGRRRLVVLTARGRQHLADADALMKRVETEWLAPLDDAQRRDLRASLATLVRASMPTDPPPPLRPVW